MGKHSSGNGFSTSSKFRGFLATGWSSFILRAYSPNLPVSESLRPSHWNSFLVLVLNSLPGPQPALKLQLKQ
jgi:hypothetical protein